LFVLQDGKLARHGDIVMLHGVMRHGFISALKEEADFLGHVRLYKGLPDHFRFAPDNWTPYNQVTAEEALDLLYHHYPSSRSGYLQPPSIAALNLAMELEANGVQIHLPKAQVL